MRLRLRLWKYVHSPGKRTSCMKCVSMNGSLSIYVCACIDINILLNISWYYFVGVVFSVPLSWIKLIINLIFTRFFFYSLFSLAKQIYILFLFDSVFFVFDFVFVARDPMRKLHLFFYPFSIEFSISIFDLIANQILDYK